MSELLQGPYTRAEVAAMFELQPKAVPRQIKALSLVRSYVFTEPTVSRKRAEQWYLAAKTGDLFPKNGGG